MTKIRSYCKSWRLDIVVAMVMTMHLMNGRSEDSDHEAAYRAPFPHTSSGLKGPIGHAWEFAAPVINRNAKSV